ncbi:hypothetical protein K8I31_00885, partial [bacterium]|nr:hypothetical protein [bacterium]
VLDHGWSEYQERGNFDPELVSFAYLINSMIRGTILPAACLTWAAAFGRHLLWPKNESVELRPAMISQDDADAPQYELIIKQSDESNDKMRMLGYVLRSAFGAFFATPSEQQETLLGQIHEISNSHGKVLEGLSDLKVGIPVHIR